MSLWTKDLDWDTQTLSEKMHSLKTFLVVWTTMVDRNRTQLNVELGLELVVNRELLGAMEYILH